MYKHLFTFFFLLLVSKVFGQLFGDFENWSELQPTLYQVELEDSFQVQDPVMGIPLNWEENSIMVGVSRTTDAYEQEYAIILHNWYFYINQEINFKTSIEDYPQSLSGYYKFSHEDYLDASGISPKGYGEIIISNAADEIVSSLEFSLDTASGYQYFEVDIPQIPNVDFDSIQVVFRNTENSINCLHNKEICNLLYLDGLELNYATNTSRIANQAPKVYPNPTKGRLTVEVDRDELDKIVLYDLYGNYLKDFASQNEISLDEFKAGVYLLKIYSNGEASLIKVFKQ